MCIQVTVVEIKSEDLAAIVFQQLSRKWLSGGEPERLLGVGLDRFILSIHDAEGIDAVLWPFRDFKGHVNLRFVIADLRLNFGLCESLVLIKIRQEIDA